MATYIDKWGNRVKTGPSNPNVDWEKKLDRRLASKRVTLKMTEVAERKRRERLAWQAGYDQAIADLEKG